MAQLLCRMLAALVVPAAQVMAAEGNDAGPSQASTAQAAEPACGPDVPCTVAGGSYLIRMPDGWDGQSPVGAVIYMHGWQGTAAGVMKFAALNRAASEQGLALVAPQGKRKTWSYPGSPSNHRDEFAFFDALYADLVARFPIDRERLVASGFSMGGSMAWYLACFRGEQYAGFVPIAGAFWRPHPERCPAAPPTLVHVHGMADRTVPMTGRQILEDFRQGDVREALAYWRRKAQCSPEERAAHTSVGRLNCTRYDGCSDAMLELCLHQGGHSIRAEWLTYGLERIAEVRGW